MPFAKSAKAMPPSLCALAAALVWPAPASMNIQLLSFLVSLIALVVSVVALVRSRKHFEVSKAHSEYSLSPKLSLSEIDLNIHLSGANFEASGMLSCHSQTAVKVVGVFLEYGDEMEPSKRQRMGILGSSYISDTQPKSFKTSATHYLAESVTSRFGLAEVYYWLAVVYHGIYGEEITARYYLLHYENDSGSVCTRCPADQAL